MKLQEAVNNAYMIRNDGKLFQMLQHVYGNPDEVEETLAAAEWLYGATKHSSTKDLILNFVATWAYQCDPDTDSLVQTCHNEISKRPYRFLSHGFIDSIENELSQERVNFDMDDLNELVYNELNQEFLRARYGGMYNSTVGSHEMVFRVSSVGFNWFNIIYQFVYDNKNRIDSVTVVHDEETTGVDDAYEHHGKKMVRMPIDEFIMLPGNPVIEEFNHSNSMRHRLKEGCSIIDSTNSNINYGRLNNKYLRCLYIEHQESNNILC